MQQAQRVAAGAAISDRMVVKGGYGKNWSITAVEALREAGAEVVAVAVIVERGARPKVTEAGLPYITVFELEDLDLA